LKIKLLVPPALAAIFLLLVSVPAFAHHGAASYDTSKMTTLKGTVTSIQWMNPHATIDIEVNDTTGKAEKYIVESVSPLGLSRNGWTKDSLKPGDQITVTGNLSKNGTHILRLKKIVFPNGKELTLQNGEDYPGQ
jgi:hydrogenase maturation factor